MMVTVGVLRREPSFGTIWYVMVEAVTQCGTSRWGQSFTLYEHGNGWFLY